MSRLSESPSPAVLLVDDYVHLPGSVFCNPPMRDQQTDTYREGLMQKLINTQGDNKDKHTPALLSSLFTKS